MKYYSLNQNSKKVNFKDAVTQGLAPDKGLYFPEEILALPKTFFDNIENLDHKEIAFQVIHQFIGDEIPTEILKEIIAETLSFDFPLAEVEKNIYALELFHGPTMAFKDVGARFMSRCLGYFNKDKKLIDIQEMTATAMMQVDLPNYTSPAPAQYALEMPARWFEKNKVEVGARLRLKGEK